MSFYSFGVTRPGITLVRAAFVFPLMTSCVAKDAGYGDVRRSVLERTRHDVRWGAVDAGGQVDSRTRALLGKPLSADDAVQLALLNNPDVQIAFEELGIARADLVRAIRLPNPTAEAAVHYHGGEPEVELGAFIGLTDLLFLPSRSGAAQAGLDAAKLAVAGAVLDVAFRVRVAYLRYVAARQIVELRRTVLLATSGSYQTAKELHEAGNIVDLDVANERALYEDARLLVARAETEGASARARLGSLMGVSPLGTGWKTAERLPPPESARLASPEVVRRALANSLDLELARLRFAAAAKRANLSRAEGLVPDIQAGAIAEKEKDEGWGFGPAVQVEIPLFYQGGGEVARATSEMRRLQNGHTATTLRVRATAADVTTRLETASAALTFYRDVLLPLREQIVQQTQLQYNAMNMSVFQLLQSKRDQIETARDYVEAQRDYWMAKAELDQLLAGRLPPESMSGSDEVSGAGGSLTSPGERH